jgi:hypothetical protein
MLIQILKILLKGHLVEKIKELLIKFINMKLDIYLKDKESKGSNK